MRFNARRHAARRAGGSAVVLAALLMPPVAVVAQQAATSPSPAAQANIVLWPDGAPGADARKQEAEVVRDTYVSNVHAPSLTVFRADARHANGAAVIIAPGGGHRMLVMVNEGVVPARALNRFGVTVFVLKYRLARDESAPTGSPYSIQQAADDMRQAVRWVRKHAPEYAVDPQRVGVMGFSAGGELVTQVANHAAPGAGEDNRVARPDFQILIYPGPLGIPAPAAGQAPPAFIAAGSLDTCCAPPALQLYQQLVAAGVSAELHLYADTGHGFNLAARSERVSIAHWPDRLHDWLSDGGWLEPRSGRPAGGVPAPTPQP